MHLVLTAWLVFSLSISTAVSAGQNVATHENDPVISDTLEQSTNAAAVLYDSGVLSETDDDVEGAPVAEAQKLFPVGSDIDDDDGVVYGDNDTDGGRGDPDHLEIDDEEISHQDEGVDDGVTVNGAEAAEHHVEKRDLNERIRQHMNEHQHQRSVNYTSCHTCRKMHLDMKQASLDHIKKYVLTFLGFNDGPPKKPGMWPSVPDYILDMYNAQAASVGDEDWNQERMNQQDQQKYLDMTSKEGPDHGYAADDPNWNLRMVQQPQGQLQDEESSFTPVVKTNRIYLFPNVTKFRHQQHDLMSFEFPASMSKRKKNQQQPGDSLNPLLHLDVAKAVLHVSFCNEHSNQAQLEELRKQYTAQKTQFRVVVHRLIAKEHQNPGSEKFSKEEVSVEVPAHLLESLLFSDHHQGAQKNGSTSGSNGKRKCRRRVELDISQLVKDWYKYPKKNHGLLLTTEPMRLKNLISMKQTEHKPFLELWTESTRKKRVKRDLAMTCNEGDNERRCCMYPLRVDFEVFGWDFIIAPKSYEANYCAGECSINFLPSYTHTHMMQLSTSAPACCSPKKMQPLSLLYFNRKEQVIHTKMENMIVDTCGCS